METKKVTLVASNRGGSFFFYYVELKAGEERGDFVCENYCRNEILPEHLNPSGFFFSFVEIKQCTHTKKLDDK